MSDDQNGEGSNKGDKVGYGRPPKHTRFKPGQSGNPKGKAKGLRNVATDVQQALNAVVRVNADGKPRKMSAQKAVVLRTVEKALKGDSRAAAQVLELMQRYNNDAPPARKAATSADDQALLDAMKKDILEDDRVARAAAKPKSGG